MKRPRFRARCAADGSGGFWPGLRAGQSGSGLAVDNATGLTQIRWGWGL